MFDVYAQRSNYNFKGIVYNQPRYFQEDTEISVKDRIFNYKKGEENPYFKVDGEEFLFNITSNNVIDKKQPLTNLVVRVEQIMIDTKFKHPYFVQGGYIGFNGKLWIVKTANEEKGPQKSIYSFFNINPLSTMTMLLEEVQE